jgi:hypothetical protein
VDGAVVVVDEVVDVGAAGPVQSGVVPARVVEGRDDVALVVGGEEGAGVVAVTLGDDRVGVARVQDVTPRGGAQRDAE